MDKRRWPWRKKTSASDISCANQTDKGKPNFVSIPIESYNHLTALEDRVKSYEDQVHTLEDEIEGLNQKLSEAHSEITNKDNAVKQHEKVAEEAIAGWEKAETEADTLKTQLESLTLLKLTAEDRSSYLDGALKECMRQTQILKEEHSQKLQDLVTLFDKMKIGLEAQISSLEENLTNSAADNSTLLRTLQDRTNTVMKLSEEKKEGEADIEFLKSKIESCGKEINSLKYEVHVARKEAEIRSEEKDMSLRSLEVVNKQHLEGARKIAKLEAESQRLRSLVRKKLPGPGALAQMKLEVGSLCDPRLKRSHDTSLRWQKENEVLMERLVAMDEHARALNEALENRDGELEASRRTCKLLEESQVQTNGDSASSIHMDDFLEMEKHVKREDDCVDRELEMAVSCIIDFVMNLGKEAKDVQGTSFDEDGVIQKLSDKYTGGVKRKKELSSFVLDISHVLTRLQSGTSSSSDCVDKIVLPENNCCPNKHSEFSDTESNALRMEELEITKCRLAETEAILADVRSQLESCQMSNDVAGTQLKCMVESYRTLEKRAEDSQTEVKFLHGKIVVLENEVKEEKKMHQETVTRIDACTTADDSKTGQEDQDFASAAAETLAECQETIFRLDKQLKALRPQTNNAVANDVSLEEETSGVSHSHQSETDVSNSFSSSSELTLGHLLNGQDSPESESSKRKTDAKHGPLKSRGFSRLFSSK